jgi:Uma2 family endonuclease
MNQAEFHALYEQTPEGFKAELIGGIVYVRPVRSPQHETVHYWLSAILLAYQMSTPGIEVCDNATVILDHDAEPQPDLLVRRSAKSGGTSACRADGYLQGPPELVIEIAQSRKSLELHAKLQDYRRYRVPEYLVYILDEQRLRWFDLQVSQELLPDRDGILKIRRFPGLWIDQPALVSNNRTRMIATAQRGIAEPAHQVFTHDLSAILPSRPLPMRR